MPDIFVARGKTRTVCYARSSKARLAFITDFEKIFHNGEDMYVIRDTEAADDLVRDWLKCGYDVEVR